MTERRIFTLNSCFDGLSAYYFKWDPEHPVLFKEGKPCQPIGKGFVPRHYTSFLNFNSCIYRLFTSLPSGCAYMCANNTCETNNTATGGRLSRPQYHYCGGYRVTTNNTSSNVPMVTDTPTIPMDISSQWLSATNTYVCLTGTIPNWRNIQFTSTHRRMCENYTGDTCGDVIGEALISNVHSSVCSLERKVQG